MTDEEIGNLIGLFLAQNWSYFLGGFIAFIFSCILLSWRISKSLPQREVELLKTEIAHQKERFSQYISIVEQRINLLQGEADALNRKLNPKKQPSVLYQSPVTNQEPKERTETEELINKPMFSRRAPTEAEKDEQRIEKLLDRTDIIKDIIASVWKII